MADVTVQLTQGVKYFLDSTTTFPRPTTKTAAQGIGYATGAGAAVTQITSRATGVTCNALSGTITTDTTSLAVEVSADFVVTNSCVAIGDVIALSIQSGSVGVSTSVSV